MMHLILASSSPRRQAFIQALGIRFEVIKPDIDETQAPDESPLAYVERLSAAKAAAVAAQLTASAAKNAFVLAADTIVLAADTIGISTQNGAILGKPADITEARDTLRTLRAHPHYVHTAFRLLRLADGVAVDERVATRVIMRPYTDAEIDAYIASGDPFDKAGGYAIQNSAFHPVSQIDGCYTNVVGLPMCAVKRALVQLGWQQITAPPTCDCPPYQPPA